GRSPSSALRFRISVPMASSASKRCCGVERDQAGNAACAAPTASFACFSVARAYLPMTSRVSDGLVLAYSPEPSAQAPLMKLPKTLGLSIALLAHAMIAAPEPQMRCAVPPL